MFKRILIIGLPVTASLGMLPYGFHFPDMLGIQEATLSLVLGIIFAVASASANALLGICSLLSYRSNDGFYKKMTISIICFLASIPSAFLCFFGYEKTLPKAINISLSVVILVVNTAIAYRAINELYLATKSYFNQQTKIKTTWQMKLILVKLLGFLVGLMVTVTFFLASYKGLLGVLNQFTKNHILANHVALGIALLSWIPVMALFAHSTQLVFQDGFMLLTNRNVLKKFNGIQLGLGAYALLSGSGFAQMAATFFSQIDLILSVHPLSSFTYLTIVGLALIANAAVNYHALIELTKTNLNYNDHIPAILNQY